MTPPSRARLAVPRAGPPPVPIVPHALTRDDIAAVAIVYRRAHARFRRWGTASVFGGLATGAMLLTLGDTLGWAAAWQPVFFAGGWLLALGGVAHFWRCRRRVLSSMDFRCASCETVLMETAPPRTGLIRADLIVAPVSARCVDSPFSPLKPDGQPAARSAPLMAALPCHIMRFPRAALMR